MMIDFYAGIVWHKEFQLSMRDSTCNIDNKSTAYEMHSEYDNGPRTAMMKIKTKVFMNR